MHCEYFLAANCYCNHVSLVQQLLRYFYSGPFISGRPVVPLNIMFGIRTVIFRKGHNYPLGGMEEDCGCSFSISLVPSCCQVEAVGPAFSAVVCWSELVGDPPLLAKTGQGCQQVVSHQLSAIVVALWRKVDSCPGQRGFCDGRRRRYGSRRYVRNDRNERVLSW